MEKYLLNQYHCDVARKWIFRFDVFNKSWEWGSRNSELHGWNWGQISSCMYMKGCF